MTYITAVSRTLMGPGPSDVPQRILQAMSQPTMGHLDPLFQSMMEEIKDLLRYAFQTENRLTFPVSAPGSAGMETCFVNLVEPGDKVIVCQNGAFGGRMKENVERIGGTAIMVQDDWGSAISLEKIERALKDHADATILAFVHAETSTGVLSDAKALCQLARDHDCLTIVDAVTSLGGIPLKVDEWGIDAIYSGTQKCLSCPPGLSPVSFNQRAIAKVKARKTKVQSWFMDLNLVMAYWDNDDGASARVYHHTAPVNAMYALYESLLMLKEEGLEAAWARHRAQHDALRKGLKHMGIEFLVDEKDRLPQLNSVLIPSGVENEAHIRHQLMEKHSLEIGAGLGILAGKIWRIGLMGHSARPENVEKCLSALKDVLPQSQKLS